MISLKSFLPVLSKHTDVSVTALYERQRALVRLGLYPAPTQSGRNSGGAMATPGNVAIMLLSVLVTDRLSEVDDRMLDYLLLKPESSPIVYGGARLDCCPFTGQRNLYRSLQVLVNGGPDLELVDISVDRKRRLVFFDCPDPDGPAGVTFGEVTDHPKVRQVVQYSHLLEVSEDLWLCNQPPENRVGMYNPLERN